MAKVVLIVDDSETDRGVVKKVLGGAGYSIIEAPDGAVGVDMAKKHKPAVVVMDVVMKPEMSGFQATRQITTGEDTKGIPVIICSSKDQKTDKIWGERQGAKGYITKPVNGGELLQTVQGLIGKP